MKLTHDDLNYSCEVLTALQGLRDDFDCMVHRAEVELTGGQRVVFEYDQKRGAHVLSEVQD